MEGFSHYIIIKCVHFVALETAFIYYNVLMNKENIPLKTSLSLIISCLEEI
jgi:hypothetical protein